MGRLDLKWIEAAYRLLVPAIRMHVKLRLDLSGGSPIEEGTPNADVYGKEHLGMNVLCELKFCSIQ